MTARKRWDGRRLHFVGAGGCGMSGLALAAHWLGASVTGSDRSGGPFLPRLRDRGISVTLGHSVDALPDGAEVVVSSAIPFDNPERAGASERGLREIGRGQLLAELVQMRRCVAVAGSHGKTTTAAMIVHALSGAGRSVDFVIGGDLLATGINADWRDRAWCVVETDESDRSLLELAPEIAVLTNVEHEHVETFPAVSDVEEVFRAFLGQSEHAVVWDRPQVRALRDGPVSTFDAPGALLMPQGSQFSWRGRTVRLRVPGAHNALNAAAALEACVSAGADPDASAAALADFPGVARRFEHIGHTASGAEIYDDYAHHPSEVMAALAAARTLEPDRLVAVLRPWGLARTQAMAHAYGVALASADLVVVLDVASEGKQPGSSSGAGPRLIVDAAIAAAPLRPTRWISGLDAVERFLHEELDPEAMCVTLGCGDVAQRLLYSPISTPAH
jgi:UDP-N-acetylmuramate--alanine ligase